MMNPRASMPRSPFCCMICNMRWQAVAGASSPEKAEPTSNPAFNIAAARHNEITAPSAPSPKCLCSDACAKHSSTS
eukprot:15274686-Alexandrium_andersonii.AAC.1